MYGLIQTMFFNIVGGNPILHYKSLQNQEEEDCLLIVPCIIRPTAAVRAVKIIKFIC